MAATTANASANALLLAAALILCFGALAGLFRLRRTLGIGLFTTALGTLHFLETYLAAVLYVGLPGGIVTSPGSSVIFAGKLVMLLLVYVREDAATVRQPIYGLLAGNVLILGLILILRHTVPTGHASDLGFMHDMGWLMVWGTIVLYVDALAIVVLYEKLGRWFPSGSFARIWLAVALVLSFDQVAFYGALWVLFGAPSEVLLGGWIAKMASGLAYAVLAASYLRFAERRMRVETTRRGGWDLFGALTYRERYIALLDEAQRDALTGLLNRGRLETHGRQAVDLALAAGQEVSLLLVDIDRFKSINDRFGHAAGDAVLREVGAAIGRETRGGDYVFRYGGDEFLICAIGLGPDAALGLAERIRVAGGQVALPESGESVGLGIGIGLGIGAASGPADATSFAKLFGLADARLYQGKRIERTRLRHAVSSLSLPPAEPGGTASAGASETRIAQAVRTGRPSSG